ncbi:MAG: hypothetical protein CMJ64_10590 [Planctomycetaceae bacterium]|nr:hypothetical protein [Planctomycetaceae bacterium]
MRIRCLPRSLFLLACPLIFLSGCASLGGSVGDLFGPEPEISKSDVPPPKGVPSFVVELRPENKPAEPHKLPLMDEATYVAQVVEKSRAIKRFGRVKIELWRPRPDGAGHHKLDVPFDRKGGAIPPGYDYAIRPNDRLVIIEDASTILDDMLDSVTGPVSAAIR